MPAAQDNSWLQL